jgi:hypothetical protein
MRSRRIVPLSKEQGCDAVRYNFEDVLTTLTQSSIPAKMRITLYHSGEKISEKNRNRLIDALSVSKLSPGMLLTINKCNQYLGSDGIKLIFKALQNRQQDLPKNFKLCLNIDLNYQYNEEMLINLYKVFSSEKLPSGLTLRFCYTQNFEDVLYLLTALKCHNRLPENFTLDLSHYKFGRVQLHFDSLLNLLSDLSYSPGFTLDLRAVEMKDVGAKKVIELLNKKDFEHNFTLNLTGNLFSDLTYQSFAAIFTSLVLNDCFKIILPFYQHFPNNTRFEDVVQCFIEKLKVNQKRYRFGTWIEFDGLSFSAEMAPLERLLLKYDQLIYSGYYYTLSRMGFNQLRRDPQYNEEDHSRKKRKVNPDDKYSAGERKYYHDAPLAAPKLFLPAPCVRLVFSYLVPVGNFKSIGSMAQFRNDVWLMEQFRFKFANELNRLNNRWMIGYFPFFNSSPSDVFIDLSCEESGLGYALDDLGLHLLLDFLASQNLKNIKLTLDLKGCAVTADAVLWFAEHLEAKVYNNLYCSLILSADDFKKDNFKEDDEKEDDFIDTLSDILFNGQSVQDTSLIYEEEEHSDAIKCHVRLGERPHHAASRESELSVGRSMCQIM